MNAGQKMKHRKSNDRELASLTSNSSTQHSQKLDAQKLIVRQQGLADYETVWSLMKAFVDQRHDDTADEIWLLQHHPVFTLGQAGKEEHILNPGKIKVVRSDRGGQVTYHGPGQLVVYLLLDIARLNIGVRQLVTGIESAIISLLQTHGLTGESIKSAPGVYIEGKKIASLGLRIRKGRCYHGLSLNVDMDLSPFTGINPCGYKSMEVTQLKDYGIRQTVDQIGEQLIDHLAQALNLPQAQSSPC